MAVFHFRNKVLESCRARQRDYRPGAQQMAVSSADDWLVPLAGKLENAIILSPRTHPVAFQSMNRPAVAGEQFFGGNRLRPGRPGDERVIQNDQAAAGCENLKQFIVASTPRRRLNL